jgi:protein TonB
VAKPAAPVVEKKPDAAPPANIAKNDPPAPIKPADSEISADPVDAGNLTSYCKDLVKPVYPSMALQTRTTGDVNVVVTLDEEGKVVDAKAKTGVQSLRTAAEAAVKRSKFAPVMKNGKPVRATGFMLFKFNLNS